MSAKIYLRNNGSFGASCEGVQDTGHHITEDSGLFTVYDHDDDILCKGATRENAEAAIAMDWRKGGAA